MINDERINELISVHNELEQKLIATSDITLVSQINDYYRKLLLLSCASLYEYCISDAIEKKCKKEISTAELYSFTSNKAIKRQYHTYFDWKIESNINQFLGLWGNDFKVKISSEIKENPQLTDGMKAFLNIGYERNQLVHEDFLNYSLQKSFEDISNLNCKAVVFVNYLVSVINEAP